MSRIGSRYVSQNRRPLWTPKKACWCWLLCFWVGTTFGQLADFPPSLARDWYHAHKQTLGEDPQAFVDEGLTLLNEYDRAERIHDVAWASFFVGNIYRLYIYDYPSAISYFNRSASEFVQVGDSIGLAFALRNLGNCHNLVGEWDLAENQLSESIRILQQSEYQAEWGYALNTMGNLQKARGDFQRALGYLKQARAVGQQTGEVRLEAYALNNMGTCYDEAHMLDSAYAAYQQSLRLLVSLGRRKDVATIWLNLARIAGARQQYELALAHYEEAFSIYREFKNYYGQALIYSNLVHFWREQKEWKKAEQNARANIALSEQMGFSRNQLTGWRTLGAIYRELGQYELSQTYFTNSLKVATPDFTPSQIQPAPHAGKMLMPFESIHLLHDIALNYEALAMQEDSLKLTHLTWSAAYYRAAIDLVDTLRIRSFAKRSQVHVAAINYGLFAQAISINYQRYQLTHDPALLEEIWYISERSRNFLLFQAYQLPNPRQDSVMNGRHLSLSDYQQALDPNEATIVYMLGKSEVLGLKITADSIQIKGLAKRASVDQWIDSLHTAISRCWTHRIRCQHMPSSMCDSLPYWENLDQQIFARMGHALYQVLCEPIWPYPYSHPNITIIADGKLQLLPFDVLLQRRIDPAELGHYRAYPYLLDAYEIAYGYDLFEPYSLVSPTARVIGMAPFQAETPVFAGLREEFGAVLTATSQDWNALPHSAVEMEVLQDTYRALCRTGKEATKTWLLEDAPPFSILHISSHAYAHLHQPETSFIAFSDTVMSLMHIQQQVWPSELVVLSACQTGLGSFVPGEGVISLGRAFHEAGAQSTLSTLWRVEDRATSEVIEGFYEELSQGASKATALRKARMAYIKQHDNRLAHPFFWGGWKLMGNLDPIIAQRQPINWFYWIIAGLIASLGMRLIWQYRGKQ